MAANFADGSRVWADAIWGSWNADLCLEGTVPPAGDTTPPTVAIEAIDGDENNIVRDTWIWVTADDNITIGDQLGFHVALFADNADFNKPLDTDWAVSGGGYFNLFLRSSQLTNGRHELLVYAFDRARNASTPATVTVNIANKPAVVPGDYSADNMKNLIRQQAQEAGDPPILVPGRGSFPLTAVLLAIANCESTFNPVIVGKDNDVGLFQFIPGTWALTPQGKAGLDRKDPVANTNAAIHVILNWPNWFSQWHCNWTVYL